MTAGVAAGSHARVGFIRGYLRLAAVSAATALAVGLLGYMPTVAVAGRDTLPGMVAGIAVSLVAGILGAIPVGLAVSRTPQKAPQAVMLSTALRFAVVLALAAALILSGRVDRVVAAVWIGISYLVMLAVDTVFAVRAVAAVRGRQ